MGSYDYSPYKNIDLQVNLKKADYSQEHKAMFLYFDLQIRNDVSEDIYFNPGRLQARVNSISSKATYYDSLASVMPERKILERGKSSFNLYFVLPGMVDLKSIDSFEVLNFGLDQGKDSSRS
jgi:hypothetical protein